MRQALVVMAAVLAGHLVSLPTCPGLHLAALQDSRERLASPLGVKWNHVFHKTGLKHPSSPTFTTIQPHYTAPLIASAENVKYFKAAGMVDDNVTSDTCARLIYLL